jgi:hypothetical protein
MKIWTCKIGECEDSALLRNGEYYGADGPMREAVREAYIRITGQEPKFAFSGWAGTLTEVERQVVEGK